MVFIVIQSYLGYPVPAVQGKLARHIRLDSFTPTAGEARQTASMGPTSQSENLVPPASAAPETEKPTFSLIICSRNRAASLQRCLQAIPSPEMREVGGELILVDNNSTDDTLQVMRAFQETAGFPVVIITERKAGLGNARNAGLGRAQGDIIAFTDDDCYLAPGYVNQITEVFKSGKFQYCGGRILLYDETDSTYCCNLSDVFQLTPPHSFLPAGIISGANMVVTRAVVEEVGFFDPMLGAGTLFRCEDIDYCARASLAGFTGAHVPGLVVYHHHGRKPGPAINSLARQNDYARGAYYAKFILAGHCKYFTGWLRLARNQTSREATWREVQGATRYIIARISVTLTLRIRCCLDVARHYFRPRGASRLG